MPLDRTRSHPSPCAHVIIYATLKKNTSPVTPLPLHLPPCFSDLLCTKLQNKTCLYLLSFFSPSILSWIHSNEASLLPTFWVILSCHKAFNTDNKLIISILQWRNWSSERLRPLEYSIAELKPEPCFTICSLPLSTSWFATKQRSVCKQGHGRRSAWWTVCTEHVTISS